MEVIPVRMCHLALFPLHQWMDLFCACAVCVCAVCRVSVCTLAEKLDQFLVCFSPVFVKPCFPCINESIMAWDYFLSHSKILQKVCINACVRGKCVFVCKWDLGQVLKDNPLVSPLIKFRVFMCAWLCVSVFERAFISLKSHPSMV